MRAIARTMSKPVASNPATPPPYRTFITSSTNVGAFFIATKRLRYLGAEIACERDGVDFHFDDFDGVGAQLSNDYRMGTAEPVQPKALFDGQKFLRDEVGRVRMGVANAKPAHR